MNGNFELLIPILLPVVTGSILVAMKKWNRTVRLRVVTILVLAVSVAVTLVNTMTGEKSLFLWNITDGMPILLRLDDVGRWFSSLVAIMWLLVAFYSSEYLKHEERENQFFGFYLITYGIIIGLDYSGSLMTLYLFYELMTMVTVTLVVHSRTKEAVAAGLKYLIYSLFGAFMGLLGIFFIHKYGSTLEFTPGGVLIATADKELLLVIAFVAILGFSTKAGMFPLHGWLPTAHPVAPAPASAVLSGIITKSGVLALIRVIYYIFGDAFIRGTWVQYTWMILALATVLMGSMMAYKEKILKKRLAYSTVSQVSYILFGLALLTPDGFTGAMLHVVFHSVLKITLFLAAGAIMFKTGHTKVEELRGIGQQMPLTLAFYSIASLGLIGIPPLNGFISKWYLASGALAAEVSVFSWLGPVILLISAILTAGYLLPMAMEGFFPGKEFKRLKKDEVPLQMLAPMGILAFGTVLLGVFPNFLTDFIGNIITAVF